MAIAPEGNFTQTFVEALDGHARAGQPTYRASQDSITFHSGTKAKFGYYINDRFLFGSILEEGTPLFSFNSMGKVAFPGITASRWQTYIVFDLEDIKARGFRSKLNWGDHIAPKRNIRKFKKRRPEKTVTIGSQEWFALDYFSMDWNSTQDMCPAGWHIPSVADWETLIDFVEKKQLRRTHRTEPQDGQGLAQERFQPARVQRPVLRRLRKQARRAGMRHLLDFGQGRIRRSLQDFPMRQAVFHKRQNGKHSLFPLRQGRRIQGQGKYAQKVKLGPRQVPNA